MKLPIIGYWNAQPIINQVNIVHIHIHLHEIFQKAKNLPRQ